MSRSPLPRALSSALAVLGALALLAASAAPARAQTPDGAALSPEDSYKLHMRNGVKLFQDRNYRAAIVEFSAAYDASPKASPLVNLALCHKAAFDYPQAIAALEKALAQHKDSMDAADQRAATDAVAEMRALLAYVTVRLTPREATLLLDGTALPPGTADAPVPLGPGTHSLSARAEGYAPAERSVTVVSGQKDVVVELALVPNQGYVSVFAADAETAIAVDGRAVASGVWAGLLEPGPHVVQMYKGSGAVESRQILVVAGKMLEVRPGQGGVAVQVGSPNAGGRSAAPPPKPPAERSGLFAVATGSLLGPTRHPEGFPEAKNNTGAAAGARVGYQVNDNAGFDASFEYGNATLRSERDEDLEYSISSLRFGLDLRLTTSGETVRFLGSLGGGVARSDLSFSMSESALGRCERGESGDCNAAVLRTCTSESGCTSVDPYFAAEAGVELDLGGVLVGVVLTGSFQATKGFDPVSVYDNQPLGFAGGGVRIGYGDW